MVTIAQRIEALRTQKGMSRPGLSAALGLPRQAVEKFETGRLTPNQEQQAKIAAYFGVSVGYLLGQSDTASDVLDQVDVAFYGEFKELDEEQKETIRDMVRLMRSRRASNGNTGEK